MKKRILSLLTAFCMVLVMFSGVIDTQAVSVHTISSLEELKQLAADVNAGNDYSSVRIVLTQDIYMNPVTDENGDLIDVFDESGNLLLEDPELWTPIGTSENPFRGTFDGKGYNIYGMVINSKDSNQGLFGAVEGAVLYNINVCESYIIGGGNIGAVVGSVTKEGIVSNCRNYNSYVYTTGKKAGGVVGVTNRSNVYNCTSYGVVYSSRCSGGVVGDVYSNAKVNNCVNFGIVNGKELVGGISGGTTNASINNCLNAGTVLYKKGYMIAGGAGSRTLTNCYSVKNDSINTGLSMGTSSKTALTFVDETAVLSSAVTVNGKSYTEVVEAMNAWVDAQSDGIYYSGWSQEDSYPYLTDQVIGSVKSMNENTFTDVDPEKWYYDEVKYVYDNGLMTGTSSNKFSPETDTSRAMVVTILYRQEGEPAVEGTSFSDVAKNQWYTNAVSWAEENGIVKGYVDGTFKPNTPISREQMAAIIHRYSEYKGFDVDKRTDLSIFPDGNTVGSWAKENVEWAVAEGLINGMYGKLSPQKEASRSQVAAILMRYCTNLLD